MKRYFFLMSVLFLFISGCDFDSTEETRLAHKIMIETSVKVREVYGFEFGGIGERGDHTEKNAYKMLGLMFSSKRRIEKDEGRKLLFAISKIFLERINSNQQIQPFLADIPFTQNNIEISIVVVPNHGTTLGENDVVGFTISSEGMMYNYRIPNTKYGLRDENETLEEARKLAGE